MVVPHITTILSFFNPNYQEQIDKKKTKWLWIELSVYKTVALPLSYKGMKIEPIEFLKWKTKWLKFWFQGKFFEKVFDN